MGYSLALIGLAVGIAIALAVIVRFVMRISRRTRPGESLWELDRLEGPPDPSETQFPGIRPRETPDEPHS